MECEKCGSTDFQEEDGFFYCLYCQTKSQVSYTVVFYHINLSF